MSNYIYLISYTVPRTFFPIISATIKEENCIAKGQWKKQHIKNGLF